MRTPPLHQLLLTAAVAACAGLLSSCETTTTRTTSTRSLPAYETPVARTDFQTVRTTAYTHSESDHLVYGRRNALGTRLYAASRPIQNASYTPRALPVGAGSQVSSSSGRSMASYLAPQKRKVTRWVKGKGKRGKRTKITVTEYVRPTIGSAAADWSRFPTGTVFRVLSTGQIYKVDDYGWALAGRNTIDLYMDSRKDMNTWGVRHEPVQILRWGDEFESRRVLAGRQSHKHVRRMLLGLQGQHEAAAALR